MQFDLNTIAKIKTPFFVYDMDRVKQKAALLQVHLSGDIKLYYALKANPHPAILQRLNLFVEGADVSSRGEIMYAVENGFKAEALSFVGPGKTDEDLHFAIKNNVGVISAESLNELKRINVIAAALNKKADVALRINPKEVVRSFSMRMGGGSSVFGVDEEDSIAVISELKKLSNCVLKGIHVYAGTQCLEEKAILDNFRSTMKIAENIIKQAGVKLEVINFGGGLGVPYYEEQEDLDASLICRKLSEEFALFKKKNACPEVYGILEIGRYIIAQAGTYVAKVVDVKTSRGKKFCVLNGGMNHVAIACGQMGQVIRRNFKISNLSKPDEASQETVTITGSLCTALDTLGTDVELPKVEVGDYLSIHNVGAYGLSASPTGFLSHDLPLELLWENGCLQNPLSAVKYAFKDIEN